MHDTVKAHMVPSNTNAGPCNTPARHHQGARCTIAGPLGKLAYLLRSCLPATLCWLSVPTAVGTSCGAAVLYQGILFDLPAQQLSANSADEADIVLSMM